MALDATDRQAYAERLSSKQHVEAESGQSRPRSLNTGRGKRRAAPTEVCLGIDALGRRVDLPAPRVGTIPDGSPLGITGRLNGLDPAAAKGTVGACPFRFAGRRPSQLNERPSIRIETGCEGVRICGAPCRLRILSGAVVAIAAHRRLCYLGNGHLDAQYVPSTSPTIAMPDATTLPRPRPITRL